MNPEYSLVPKGLTGIAAIDGLLSGVVNPTNLDVSVLLGHLGYGVGVFGAILGIVFEADIQRLREPHLTAGAALVGVVAVASLVLYAVSVVLRHLSEHQQVSQANLILHTKDLLALVIEAKQPSIPLTELHSLSAGVASASRAGVLLLQAGRPESAAELFEPTRHVLDAVERVVEAVLDKANDDISINLMAVLPNRAPAPLDAELRRVFGREYRNPYPPDIDGVPLGQIAPWVAFVVATGSSTPDDALSIQLRVPSVRDQALLGAPYAIVTLADNASHLAYQNYSKLAYDDIPCTTAIDPKWLADEKKRKALENYFVSTKILAASVLSVVLHEESPEGGKAVPVGVLNINCSQRDVFDDPVRQRLLFDTIRPLLPLLARAAAWYGEYITEGDDTDEQDRGTTPK